MVPQTTEHWKLSNDRGHLDPQCTLSQLFRHGVLSSAHNPAVLWNLEAHRTHSVSIRRCPWVLLMLVRIEPKPRTLVALRVCGVGIRRCPGVSFLFRWSNSSRQRMACMFLRCANAGCGRMSDFVSLFRDTTCSGSPKDSAPPLTARRSIPDWPSATLLHCTVDQRQPF